MTAMYRDTASEDRRDMAFDRVRRAFRRTAVAAVAALAVLMGVVAHEIPGRSSSSRTAPPTSVSGSGALPPVGTAPGATASAPQTGASASGTSLTPPTSPPVASQQSPVAVSGGTSW